jgi:RNA polymerase sigma-70 factor (ECF subfamily)
VVIAPGITESVLRSGVRTAMHGPTDDELLNRIQQGDDTAWRTLVDRYEGRLMAYVLPRVKQRPVAEDIVQETFLGFLNSLPNYDGRPLESYLFAICAHKLTDHLRREGRRPMLVPLSSTASGTTTGLAGTVRQASSVVRSGERRCIEERALVDVLRDLISHWKRRGEWVKLQCIELLIVRGWPNKVVAEKLRISEQQVANFKFDFINRMRNQLGRLGLSEDLFPELTMTST